MTKPQEALQLLSEALQPRHMSTASLSRQSFVQIEQALFVLQEVVGKPEEPKPVVPPILATGKKKL